MVHKPIPWLKVLPVHNYLELQTITHSMGTLKGYQKAKPRKLLEEQRRAAPMGDVQRHPSADVSNATASVFSETALNAW